MFRTRTRGRARLRARTLAPLLVLLVLPFVPAFAAAQAPPQARAPGNTIVVSGTVFDTSGGVLPDAVVEARVAGRTVSSAVTGADGRYRLEVPASSPYELQVRRPGFADRVAAMPGGAGPAVRDLTLEVGRVSDTLVVTASGTGASRASLTDSVSVLTAADIAAIGAASLADVLRVVPGLHVESTGREGAVTSLFARGGESDYNLVLIDGVRMNQSGGMFDFSRVGAAEIERVEVVRGAQSALYGSDAMGAVVQVFTRRASPPDAPQVSGSLEGGSFRAWRGSARVTGGARQGVDYRAGVTRRVTEGAFAGRLAEPDRFDQTTFDGAVSATLGARVSLRTGLRYGDADGRDVGPIGYGPGDTGTSYATRDLSWYLDVPHTVGSRMTGQASLSYFRSTSEFADAVPDPAFDVYAVLRGTPGAVHPRGPRLVRLVDAGEFQSLAADPARLGAGEFLAFTSFGVFDFAPSASETAFRRPSFRYQSDVEWAGQRLSGGYEYMHDSNPLVPAFRLHNHAFFVQQQLTAADRWFATIGGRLDEKSEYGTFFSPKVSAGGFLRPFTSGAVSSVKVFASVGRGIKSPQFSELFGSAFADGNPDLQPERARSVDAGAELTFLSQRVRSTAAFFDNRYRDQVEFVSSGGFGLDGQPDFVNIAGTRARGLEIDVAMQRSLGGITASGSYTLLDSGVTETTRTGAQFQPGQPLLRRPRHAGVLRVVHASGRTIIGLTARLVGERHDSSFLGLSTVPDGAPVEITVNPGYVVASLALDVLVDEGFILFVRGENITGTAYEHALGYPGLPRAVMAGVRFSLGGALTRR